MPPFTHQIFVCGNQRPPDHRRGSCDPAGTDLLRHAFRAELQKHKLGPLARANKAGCLEQCEHGPVVAIYPQGIFYGPVTPADVPRIVEETILQGRVIPELRIADDCLNNPHCPHISARNGSPGQVENR